MTRSPDDLPPIGAILSGPHWPERVRVVRVEPRGTTRLLIEAVTLDDQSRLISRLLRREDLVGLHVEAEAHRITLQGDPAGFRLAAEATRIRLAHTHDPQFAVSVARIDPLPHQLEAVYYYMLRQPRLRFLLADDPGAGKTIMAEGARAREDRVRLVAEMLINILSDDDPERRLLEGFLAGRDVLPEVPRQDEINCLLVSSKQTIG